jgi:multidrug efflux pump subunit AcrA (membrane-fusion protein)
MPAWVSRVATVPLLLLALCAGCSSSREAGAHASPSPGPPVATATAAPGVIYPSLQIAGVVTPYRQVGVAANLSEPFLDVDVAEGDHVHAGQPLGHLLTDDLQAQLVAAQRTQAEDVAHYAQLAYQTGATDAQDRSAISAAQESLRSAQVNLSGATTDLKRYEDLEAQGYLAPQTVDQQRTTVASDAAAVRSAQAALAGAQANAQANGQGTNAGELQAELAADRAAADAAQAGVEQLRRQIARATILSPIDGVVDAVNANPGEYPSGRQLFTIEQIASVYALLPTSTAQVGQIHAGATATIVSAGSARKDRGTVAAVLDQLQPGSTNFTVKVLVANADGHLHPGMPVTGVVALAPVRGIAIPVTAFIDDTRASVYAVDAGVVKTVAVREIGDDANTAIVSGLAAGTTVVRDVESVAVGNGDRITTDPGH